MSKEKVRKPVEIRLLAPAELIAGEVCVVVADGLRFRGVVQYVDSGGLRAVVMFGGGRVEPFLRSGDGWGKVLVVRR